MCLISPRYIKKEEKVRIGGILDRTTTIGEEIGHLVENKVIIVIEVMDEVEVILKEVVFEVGTVRARSESSSRSRSNSRASTNRDRFQCFKCREYDHFANECPNLVSKDSDRESDSARLASLQILADSDTGLEVEQYLNI